MIVRQVDSWSPRWSAPLPDVARMRQEMESLMDRLAGATGDAGMGVFPPMNIAQDEDHYYVRALIPGMDASQLGVSVVNQTVTVSGMRQSTEESGVSYHRKERPEGAFSRSVTLPSAFDGTSVEAKYVDGILTLTLPKPASAKPRRVPVLAS
jgi:HSP20 family protein